jgi:hypothetical protein
MSPAARHVLQEALLWGAAALGGFVLIYFFDDLKAAFGPGGSAPLVAERIETKPASSGFAGEVRLKADARGHFKFLARSTAVRRISWPIPALHSWC